MLLDDRARICLTTADHVRWCESGQMDPVSTTAISCNTRKEAIEPITVGELNVHANVFHYGQAHCGFNPGFPDGSILARSRKA